MKSNLYWIDGHWPGRLAIFARPRGGDWLADEVHGWKKAGLEMLISALEPDEAAELELERESELCLKEGIEFISFPVQDRGVPDSAERTRELATRLEKELRHGRSIGIHCRQGIGRSSLLAACILVLDDVAPAMAFEMIEQARGRPVPDTVEQRDWVTGFSARVHETSK